jgi:hypothetical protein
MIIALKAYKIKTILVCGILKMIFLVSGFFENAIFCMGNNVFGVEEYFFCMEYNFGIFCMGENFGHSCIDANFFTQFWTL